MKFLALLLAAAPVWAQATDTVPVTVTAPLDTTLTIGSTEEGAGSGNLSGVYMMPLVAPQDGTLESLSFYLAFGARPGQDVRMALYRGGASNTNPSGAEPLEDVGKLGLKENAPRWYTVNSVAHPAWTVGQRLWIAFKTNAGYGMQGHSSKLPHGFSGSLVKANGQTSDEDVVFAPLVAGSNTTSSGYYSVYLSYRTAPPDTGVILPDTIPPDTVAPPPPDTIPPPPPDTVPPDTVPAPPPVDAPTLLQQALDALQAALSAIQAALAALAGGG